MFDFSKLIIGTVQFGLDYGVSNYAGKTSLNDVFEIQEYISSKGVCMYDTAPAYGDAEVVVSRLVKQNNKIQVISKVDSVKNKSPSEVISSIHNTIKLFGDNLWGMHLHDCNDVANTEYLHVLDEIYRLKSLGYIKHVGASVYDESQLKIVTEKLILDVIQLPFNIYDQRFMDSAILSDCKSNGIEVHVRSLFLQGLILMPEDSIPDKFTKIKPYQNKLKALAQNLNISIYQLCINWVVQQPWMDRVVCGINNLIQARELVSAFEQSTGINQLGLAEYRLSDLNIIDPSRWS